MALSGREIEYFMCVGVSATPTPDQSFEELRIQDYLKSYQTTGRPPLPCPQSPDTPNARAALGLAPLFVPVAIAIPLEKTSSITSIRSTTSDAPITQLSNLPGHHDFQPIKTALNESLQCISAQTLYSHFSPEELRHQAYLSGNKMPPIPSTTGGMTDGVVNAPSIPQYFANDSSATSFMTSTSVSRTPDYFMSIVASPRFNKHSFEELRIAYLLAGKEVGSSEIPTRGALPAQPAPTLFGRPRGEAFSSSTLKLF